MSGGLSLPQASGGFLVLFLRMYCGEAVVVGGVIFEAALPFVSVRRNVLGVFLCGGHVERYGG